jgi:hypothetical protein
VSARDELIEIVTSSPESSGGDVVWATDLVDTHRAEVLTAEGQAYDGELAMLRGLVATLRVVAQHGDLPQARQLLDEHQRDEQDAYAKAGEEATAAAPAAPFFRPGRIYTREVRGDRAEFQVRHIGTHPDGTHQRAFGWYRRQPRTDWHAYSQDNADYPAWTDTTAGGA